MKLTKQQFHENLVATLREVAPESTFSQEAYRLSINPVHEPNVKHNSIDDYLRLSLLRKENIEGRIFDLESVVTFLTGPNSSYPLWIEVMHKPNKEDGACFELTISTRFRKPSELKYKETGHPPFKAVKQ